MQEQVSRNLVQIVHQPLENFTSFLHLMSSLEQAGCQCPLVGDHVAREDVVCEGERGLAADAAVQPHVSQQPHVDGLVLVKVEDLSERLPVGVPRHHHEPLEAARLDAAVQLESQPVVLQLQVRLRVLWAIHK